MLRLAILVLAWIQIPLAAQNAAKITGKITDSLTRQPIPQVHVSCMVGTQFVGALTGVDGAYALENVPPGAVRMLVNLDGYKLLNERTEPSAEFAIAAGDAVTHDFALHPLGRIYGTLVDRDTGHPIDGHPVSALRKDYHPGHVGYFATAAEQKGGEFNIRNLEAGDYVIQIDAPQGASIVFPQDESNAAAFNPTAPKAAPKRNYGQRWYPDVPRIEMAASIHLGEGESRRVDISLESRETYTLSGTVQAPREFESAPVRFALRRSSTRDVYARQMAAPGPFRIENLAPGSYKISLTAGKPPNEWAGDYQFEITRQDIANFKTALLPEAGLTGEVRMAEEGAKLPDKPGGFFLVPTSGWVELVKGGGMLIGGDMPVSGAAIVAGRFHQESIRPGEYWPVLLGLPEGYALQQTLFEGSSARNTAMNFTAPETPVVFVITSRPGAISGAVRDENQAPVRGASVALLPDPMPEKVPPGAIRMEETGDDGAFAFRNVAPGNYRAILLSGPDGAQASDIDRLRELAARADTLEVRAGQAVSINLKK